MSQQNEHNVQPGPPRYAEKVLLWFLKEDLVEEVLGDLDEKFYQTINTQSVAKARRNYWYQVIHYLRPFAISIFKTQLTNTVMIKHNFIISFRHLIKNKGYSLINIGGLALGMVVAMLIGLWVNDELSFNKNHENYDRLAKVMRFEDNQGTLEANKAMTTGMGTHLKAVFPQHFEQVVLVRQRLETRVFASGDLKFTQGGYFMQHGGPEMFSLDMLYGKRDGLKEINSLLLSASLAQKLFGDQNPMGEIIRMDAETDLKVTGVYNDLPDNSEFKLASYFAPIELYQRDLTVWNNYNMQIYVQLQPNANLNQVSDLLSKEITAHMTEDSDISDLTFFLLPMNDWNLRAEFADGIQVTSKRLQFVWFYSIIGGFVLILACINFMNLSTASSEKRAKEVGIRKTLGSIRRQLISQFYMESILYAIFGFGLSLLLLKALLPWFNETAGKGMIVPWSSPYFWLITIGFSLLTALLAGSYPAMYLSSFKPIKALKGKFVGGKGASLPRKILVVFQFTISIALIVGTITVNNQIDAAKQRSAGYNPERLLSLRPATPNFYKKLEVLRTELKNTGFVEEIGASNYSVISTLGWSGGFRWEGMDPDFRATFNTIRVSHEYANAIGMEFIDGRNFSRDLTSDNNGILINESALELLQIQDPVGKYLTRTRNETVINHTIIGVVKDMVKGSPFEASDPSIMFLESNWISWLYVRLEAHSDTRAALASIETAFSKVLPEAPFDYKFADEDYDAKFRDEQRIGDLAAFFSLLAILISCMGLFGLASYVAEQRTKEIGIRKVLGASVSNLWGLLSKDFTLLVLISCIIAIPFSFGVLHNWLQGYDEAYRTSLHWSVFAIASGGALAITLITVSFQAIKASIANPVNSLRSE